MFEKMILDICRRRNVGVGINKCGMLTKYTFTDREQPYTLP
jgi:hypothetical protein